MDITELLPKKTSVPTPQTMPNRGVISTPPAALTDLTMRVIVPGHSSDYDVECRWVRQGDVLPTVAADCLVVWDETGAGTVVAWEGAGVSLLAISAALDSRLDLLEAKVVLFDSVATEVSGFSSTSYAALSGSAGPTLTVPTAGDWVIEPGFTGFGSSNGVGVAMSYDIGATGAVDADRAYHETPLASQRVPASYPQKHTLAAATVLTAKYKVTSGTGTFSKRWLRATRIA